MAWLSVTQAGFSAAPLGIAVKFRLSGSTRDSRRDNEPCWRSGHLHESSLVSLNESHTRFSPMTPREADDSFREQILHCVIFADDNNRVIHRDGHLKKNNSIFKKSILY